MWVALGGLVGLIALGSLIFGALSYFGDEEERARDDVPPVVTTTSVTTTVTPPPTTPTATTTQPPSSSPPPPPAGTPSSPEFGLPPTRAGTVPGEAVVYRDRDGNLYVLINGKFYRCEELFQQFAEPSMPIGSTPVAYESYRLALQAIAAASPNSSAVAPLPAGAPIAWGTPSQTELAAGLQEALISLGQPPR